MNHPDDDQLLKSVLELPAPSEQQELERHLARCTACQSRIHEIQQDVSRLAGLRISTPSEYPPFILHPSSFIPSAWLRMAAVLLLGFLGGFVTSRVWPPERIVVEPMQRITFSSPSALSLASAAKEDALQTLAGKD